ncbi:MAG: hypothetical protein R2831_01990 [Chitinophagaceae bacterium]
MSVLNILSIIYKLVLILSFLIAFLYGIKYRFYTQRYFMFYMFAILCIEFSTISKPFNKSLVYNFFPIISSFYFFYFFYQELQSKKGQAFHITIFIITLLSIIIFSISKGLEQFNISSAIAYSFLIILFALQWFFNQINKPNEYAIQHKQGFWVSFGLLLWSSFLFFRIIPMYYFNTKDVLFLEWLQYIYNTINILTYILFSLGIVWNNYPSKSNTLT